MKKIGLLVLVLLVLQGCTSNSAALYEEKVKLYKSYWSSILDQNKYQKSSSNFSIKAAIAPLETGGFEYTVILDNARVAMHDVEILVLENDDAYHEDKMMPNSGILNEGVYHLIPNQSRTDQEYQSGFRLVGKSDEEDLTLHILVSWKNFPRNASFKEYFEIKPSKAE